MNCSQIHGAMKINRESYRAWQTLLKSSGPAWRKAINYLKSGKGLNNSWKREVINSARGNHDTGNCGPRECKSMKHNGECKPEKHVGSCANESLYSGLTRIPITAMAISV